MNGDHSQRDHGAQHHDSDEAGGSSQHGAFVSLVPEQDRLLQLNLEELAELCKEAKILLFSLNRQAGIGTGSGHQDTDLRNRRGSLNNLASLLNVDIQGLGGRCLLWTSVLSVTGFNTSRLQVGELSSLLVVGHVDNGVEIDKGPIDKVRVCRAKLLVSLDVLMSSVLGCREERFHSRV